MNLEQLKADLRNEAEQAFNGWNFSYLDKNCDI